MKFEKYRVNLREVLQENVLGLHLVGLDRILRAKAMKIFMCRERCQVACCSKLVLCSCST